MYRERERNKKPPVSFFSSLTMNLKVSTFSNKLLCPHLYIVYNTRIYLWCKLKVTWSSVHTLGFCLFSDADARIVQYRIVCSISKMHHILLINVDEVR